MKYECQKHKYESEKAPCQLCEAVKKVKQVMADATTESSVKPSDIRAIVDGTNRALRELELRLVNRQNEILVRLLESALSKGVPKE